MTWRPVKINIFLFELDARLSNMLKELLEGFVVFVERRQRLMEVFCLPALGHFGVDAAQVAEGHVKDHFARAAALQQEKIQKAKRLLLR